MDETPKEIVGRIGTPSADGMYQYLKDAEAAGELIRIEKGALPEHANVPLVMYMGTERIVVGEATVEGDVIRGLFGATVGEEVLGQIFGGLQEAHFSLSSDEAAIVTEEDAVSCVCPWNNGYLLRVRGHRLQCPVLKKKHFPADKCGIEGHLDGALDDEA